MSTTKYLHFFSFIICLFLPQFLYTYIYFYFIHLISFNVLLIEISTECLTYYDTPAHQGFLISSIKTAALINMKIVRNVDVGGGGVCKSMWYLMFELFNISFYTSYFSSLSFFSHSKSNLIQTFSLTHILCDSFAHRHV